MINTITSVQNRLQTQPDQNQPMIQNPYEALESTADSLEDGKLTNLNFQRFKVLDLCFFIFNLIGTGLTVLVYELIHYDQEPDARLYLLWIIFISSLLAIVVAFFRNQAKLQWKVSKGYVMGGFFYERIELIFDVIIIALAPLPFLDEELFYFSNDFVEGDVYYYVNELLCLFLSLRVIFYIRTTLMNSYWHSNRTDRVCSLYACNADYWFTIKSLMRHKPFLLNYTAMILLILIFGYALRICESPLNRLDDSSNDFSSYWNSMWCVIVTSTTLGYGDYYTRTLAGRIVISICSILGNFVVSSMIVIITNESFLSNLENKVVILIDRLSLKRQMQHEAATVITCFGRIFFLKKNLELSDTVKGELTNKMRKYSIKLKLTIRKYVAARQLGSQSEEINSGFNTIKELLKESYQLQEDVIQNNMALLGRIDKNI